jgi:hypothetical protein
LTNSKNRVNAVVNDVLVAHKEEQSLKRVEIIMEKRVAVDLEKVVPLAFSKLLGRESVLVHAAAAAEINTMGKAAGAALGIDDSIDLKFHKKYKLKVDHTGVEAGNFGALALGDPGAQQYEENLRYGYIDTIGVGDVIKTQTGNISGKTRRAINDRLDVCPYRKGETYHRDCSRVILIPVYKPHHVSNQQLMAVKITGFAYFYILEPMHSNDTSIKGVFVKRAGTGFEEEDALFNGAYAIRLTDRQK